MPWGDVGHGHVAQKPGSRRGYGSVGNAGVDTGDATPKKGGGGVGGFLKKVGSDLLNAAENSPEGVYQFGKAPLHDLTHPGDTHTFDLAAKSVEQIGHDLRHPLRHPGNTLLDVLPIAGSVAKIGEAGALAKSGASAGEVVKAATVGVKPGKRVLKVNDLEVRGHYSRAAASRVVQKGVDKALTKGAEKPGRAGVLIENRLHKRAAKWNQRNERVADSVARIPGTRLAVLGKKLKPEELRAIRLVAEETPVNRRLSAQVLRQARAKGDEVARHQERIDLTTKAQEFLDVHPTTGAPVFKPDATKLRRTYDALKNASTDRESMLKNLDLLDEQAQQAAKTKVARVAAGAKAETNGRPVDIGSVKMGDRVNAPGVKGLARVTFIDRKAGTVRVTAYDAGAKAWGEHTYPADQVDRPQQGLHGAEDISASPDAVFIGNPVERGRFTGRPKVSSTGTFGHTAKPSSLKKSTGGSVEHALERNDVTQIVAERHHEAVRLEKVDRVVQNVAKKAGEKSPRRKDDVWVWTDKITKTSRIPKEVRQYLDNPETIANLAPDKQVSVVEKLKEAVLQKEDWRNPDKVAEFEKLAEQGKGVFVPRRLLGEMAKRDYALGELPGIRFVDAVNNAQKAGLVYLKLNYPLIQGVSNVAMNLIQGAANPVTISKAVKAYHGEAEMTAVVKDIMGEGAVLQAGFEGQGRIANISQKLAHVMSSRVDTPSRLLAFYYEAEKAGYGGSAGLKRLIFDDKNVGDLAEVAQRAKEAIVDYGDLSAAERSIVRRLVFVYPWQKGATKYAGHFLRDHPLQAAAVGVLGEQGRERSDATFGPVPSYLNGIFDAGGGAVNPAGINFFQTPAQIGSAAAGVFTGNPAQRGAGQSFLAPGPATLAAFLTGHDDIGAPLKGNLAENLRDLTIGQTPAAAALRALTHGHTGLVFGGRGPSKTFPGANDALWRFFLGGLYPRQYDKGALNQNAAREKTGR